MWNSLRARLTVTYLALALGPLILVAIILTRLSFTIQESQAIDLQHQVAQRVAAEAQSHIQEVENDLRLIGSEIQGLEQPDQAQQLSILLRAMNSGAYQGVYEELVLLDAQGQEQAYVSSREMIPAGELGNRSGADEFEEPRVSRRTYFGPVRIDESTGNALMTIAVPLSELRSVQVNGVLVASLRFQTVEDAIDSLELSSGQTIHIIDPESAAHVYHNLPDSENTQFALPEQDGVQTIPGLGDVVLATHQLELGGQPLFVVAARPTSVALALANAIVRTVVIVIVAALVLAGGVGLLVARQFTQPIQELALTAQNIQAGDLSQRAEETGPREIHLLAEAFNSMTAQLRQMLQSLEARVADRTRALETSIEVSRRLSTILEQKTLVREVVEEVRSAFSYYHVHIYLYDDDHDNLLMAGGTGEAGMAMLDQGHYIRAGKGLVGRAAVDNEPVLIPDVTQNADWLPNPLLPNTKAEAAVPIAIGDEVLGVLDVQQSYVDGLGPQDVELLQSIASQVAIALQNASLFTEREEVMASVREEQERIQTILKSIATPFVISSVREGTVLYINEPLAEIIGTTPEALLGQVTPDFYADPEDRESFLAAVRQDGFINDFEVRLKRTDGDPFWALVSAQVINYQGEMALLTSVIDIDERKQAEEQLAKRANELATMAQMSTAAATLLEPQELLQQVVDLTKDSFNLYHAHIHLLNDSKDTLVLKAGAGEVGRQMVGEGRRIPLVAEESLVATVARTGQAAIRHYETPGEGFMPHPLLAETRSEMAVAIALGDELMGVLDVRSDVMGYFSEADTQVFDILASQVAVTLHNARLFQQSQKALQELDILTNRLTHEGWQTYLDTVTPNRRYTYGPPPKDDGDDAGLEDGRHISLPLQVQGAAIGQLTLAKPQEMDDEVTSIVSEVTGRLSTHIENLRLTEQTERALAGTEALYQGSERVVRANTVDDVLRALIETTTLQQFDGVSILLYDEPTTTDQVPPSSTVVAAWERSGETPVFLSPGRQLVTAEFPIARFFSRHGPVIIKDIFTDERIDEEMQDLFRSLGTNGLAVFPLVVGELWTGLIIADSNTSLEVNDEQIRRIDSLVDQAAAVIQSKRLFEQVQEALLEAQALYDFSGQLNAATDLDDIVQAVASPEISAEAENAALLLLDLDETGQPEWGTFAATWQNDEVATSTPLGTRFYLPELPMAKLWISSPHAPILVEDTESDERIDPQTRQLYQRTGTRASVVMPLSIGGQWIGLLVLTWTEPQQFTERDERLYKSMATQTAIALSNQQLLEQTQDRARRERLLRQITARVRGSADVESIMQTAVQEVGQALGRKAFIYLGNGNQEQPETSVEEKET